MTTRLHDWRVLRRLARLAGVRFVAIASAAERVNELKAQIAELLDEAKALDSLAEKEKRELTDEEHARWNALMDEDAGEIVKLRAKLKAAEKLAAERERLALERDATRNTRDPFGAPEEPADRSVPRNRIRVVSRLRNFRGEDGVRNAYTAGQYILARVGMARNNRNERAERELERLGFAASIRNVHTEGGNGGLLVPDPLSAAIVDVRDQGGVIRPLARVVPMTSDTLAIRKRLTGLTVDYPDEATAVDASDKTFGPVALTAKTRAVMTQISQELREDAIINLVDDLVSEIGTAFRVNEDREAVNGDGSAAFGGVTGLIPGLGAAGKNPVTGNWSAITLAHFTATMAILPDRFRAFDLSWICSGTFYYQVMLREMTEAGGNTIAAIEAGGASRPTFLGFPVYFTEQMPSTSGAGVVGALFGAFNQAVVLGDRIGVETGQSDDFAFSSFVTTIRARSRYDIKVHEGGDGSNAGAYVGLTTTA